MRDEGEAYAARLREAGVPVALSRYEGMIHGFFGLVSMFDQGKAAIAEAGNSLRIAFGQAASASMLAGFIGARIQCRWRRRDSLTNATGFPLARERRQYGNAVHIFRQQ